VDSQNHTGSNWRSWFVLTCLLLGFVALAYRAVDLHIFEQPFLAAQGDARAVRYELIEAHRGVIEDRNGAPLAISAPVDTVYADPALVHLSQEQIKELASLLDVSTKWLVQRLEKNKNRRFLYLRRHMAPHEVKQIMSLGLDGIYVKREFKRYYPAGEVAAHVVGFTNIDDKGQEGLELAYDDWLKSSPGKRRVLKDRRGRVIKDLGVIVDAQPGRDIKLSLDLRLQYLAYRELKAAVTAHRAKSGSLVMLDVENGDILAMVNQPAYNPNNRSNIDVASLRNRAITDVFEPGSTMKLATLAAALESGRFSLGTVLDTSPGYLRLNRRTIRDHRNYGELSLLNVIAKSSNVGTSKVALALSGDVVWDMLYRLGLGQSTGVGFPGENIGSLPHSPKWQPIKVATMSYGYGLSVTALQLAQAYMILGNGGVKYPISLIKRERQIQGEQVLSTDISQQVRSAMKAVVEKGGTGTRASLSLYEVGGKTGTVHAVGKNGYRESDYRALFAGVAPLDEPKIAVVVVVDSPAGAEYYGGEVAAPIFKRVVSGAMRLLNVTPFQAGRLQLASARGNAQ